MDVLKKYKKLKQTIATLTHPHQVASYFSQVRVYGVRFYLPAPPSREHDGDDENDNNDNKNDDADGDDDDEN